MSSADARTVVIAGAGLAGTLMAVYLARRGYRVTLCERNPDPRQEAAPAGRSINLAMAERGIHALKKARVFDLVRPLLIPMRGRMLHDLAGDETLQPYSRNPDEVIYSVSRAGLTRTLLDAAEATGRVAVRFRQRITAMDTAGTSITVEGEDGSVTRLDAGPLIAADGAGSVVRQALAAEGRIDAREELLAHRYRELTIPPGDDGGFRMAANALHIWPRGGFMLIALPNPDCSFTATLFMAEKGDPGFASLGTPASVRAFFQQYFPDTLPLIPDLERDFEANPLGILGTVRCRPWHRGGDILLIGDAAHAIVPFHGQGMNCAFEDCAVLDGMLDEYAGDWAGLFAAFSRVRRPDADAIADMALENYIEMRDTVRDPKFHLRKALAWELEALHPQRFVPRYSMVMFRRLPYALAQERGRIQARMLEALTRDVQRVDEVDMQAAAAMVAERLSPLDPSLDVG